MEGSFLIKRLVSVFSIFVLLFSFTTTADAAEYNDITSSYRFYEEITYLSDKGIIKGFPDGRFGPEEKVTRAAAAIMIGRALELDGSERKTVFPDVSPASVASGYIQSAVEKGIINGFPDNTYRPDEPVTRGQLAIFLTRAFEFEETSPQTFKDVHPNMVAYQHIQKLLAAKITDGFPDNTFRPDTDVTRGQFAAFMSRTLNKTFTPYDDLQVHFIDVGQGDATLIQTPDGANILIDAGTQSAGQKVVNFLKQKDVGKLDMVVATHPHADHIGGLIPVLNEFPVDKFIDSGNEHTSQTYFDLLTLVDSKDIPTDIATVGKVYTFDNGFRMTTIHTDSEADNLNNASVSFKAEYNKVSFLLTGDAEKDVETELVDSSFDLKSTVYKAGHHGSNTSSTQQFINKVSPEVTILSYGEGNQYGHPHDEVITRLQAIGSKLYSTADSGDITVTTNGLTYSVSAQPWIPPTPEPDPKPDPKPDPDSDPEPKPDPKPDPDPGISYPININIANYEELQNIYGVGEVIAQRIIDYRTENGPFKRIEDIKKVKGIGPATFEKMKHQITV